MREAVYFTARVVVLAAIYVAVCASMQVDLSSDAFGVGTAVVAVLAPLEIHREVGRR